MNEAGQRELALNYRWLWGVLGCSPVVVGLGVYLLLLAVSAVLDSVRLLAMAFPAVLFFWAIERFGPCHGRRPSGAAQIKGALFQVLALLTAVPMVVLISSRLPHAPPLWPALAFPLAFLVSDFGQYWEHRLEHKFLWRFHAVHHSTEDLSASSNFNHFTHHVFMTVLYGLPVAMVTRDVLGVQAVGILLYVQAAYVHSPAKLSLGPLRFVLNDNRVHRIHHSADERHHERNFGAFLTVWDFLFGTLYWPKKGEWPATGIADYGEIHSIREFCARPFMRKVAR